MKRIILTALGIFFSCMSFAQVAIEDIPEEPTFSHVFNSNLDINKKFVNAKSWIATNFGDYKSVLQYEDAENYRIIIKGKSPVRLEVTEQKSGVLTVQWKTTYQYHFTMVFDFKDDRYRIRFEDIAIKMGVSIGDKELLSDVDVKWDNYFTLDTSTAEKELAELKAQKEELQAQLNGTRRKREIERLNAEIQGIDEQIADKVDYIENRAPKKHIEDVLHFKVAFCSLLNSAAQQIEYDDDF